MAALAELCSWLSAPGNKLARLDLRDTMPSSDATDHPAQTEAAVRMLCATLASPHCVLEELNVQGFGFTTASVSRLAAPLLRPGCPLRKLHLARWPIPLGSLVDESGGLRFGGAAGCVEDVVLVSALLEHGRGGAARTLDLSAVGANLGPAAVDALAGCISQGHLPSLSHVALTDCALRRPQLEQLLRALGEGGCPLEALELGGTALCAGPPPGGRYTTEVLRVVCGLLVAPGNRMRTLGLRGTSLLGLVMFCLLTS